MQPMQSSIDQLVRELSEHRATATSFEIAPLPAKRRRNSSLLVPTHESTFVGKEKKEDNDKVISFIHETVKLMSERLQQSNDEFVKHSDASMYTKSFDVFDTEGIAQFFAQFGFVCVRNVVDELHAFEAVGCVIKDVATQAGDGVNAENWQTFINSRMPEGYSRGVLDGSTLQEFRAAGGLLNNCAKNSENMSFLDKFPLRVDRLTHHQSLWRTRTNENLYRTFADLLHCSRLFCSIGCIHFMRPRFARPSNQLEDWRTYQKTTCWEQPPLKDNKFNGLQGLLVLSDAPEEAGGLELVPGFQYVYDKWLLLQKSTTNRSKRSKRLKTDEQTLLADGRLPLPKSVFAERLVNSFLVRLPVRAGTLIIFDRRLPFRTFHNNSARLPFVAQEITFFQRPPRNSSADAYACRLRLASIEHGVRFTSIPEVTGHNSCHFARWHREVRREVATTPYCRPIFTNNILAQCLVGECDYSEEMLRFLNLPVYAE